MSDLIARDRLAPPPPPEDGRRPPKPPRRGGRSPFRWAARLVSTIFAIAFLGALAAVAGAYAVYLRVAGDLPDVNGLRSYQPPVMSRVYAGDARLMAELATERRIFVPYAAIPDLVKHAFVSAEDQNFFVHRGVDPLAIARAAVTDLSHMGQGRRPIGASTITQQVAKNMLLDNAPTLTRKLKEAILAVRIEDSLTKDRILELYLNEIYLGAQAYGVAAAAQAYFNKPLDEVTPGEAAFLAALPKAPNNYNPFKFPDAARARRDWVLDRMAEDRVVPQQQADAAKTQPVVAAQFRRPEPPAGSDWFAEEVRRRLVERFGADATTQGGLMVRTSMDPALQIEAERALRDGLMSYDRKNGGWRGPAGRLGAPAAALKAGWAGPLAAQARPPGMLPEWRLAVVTDETDAEAHVGWLEPDGGQRRGAVALSDLGWARPVHDGRFGPAPRRIADVMAPGDLVMVEPAAASSARVQLRQIPAVQGALVSMDPATGRVLAMVGGWSYDQSQFNRATQAERQPGSSFKPMVYLTALEQGVSPSQKFLDAPFVMNMGSEGVWRPNNYEMTFSGPTPMRIALEKSLNLVTLRVAQKAGMDAVAQTAIAFHVVDKMPRVLPAALGAVDTTVIRQAGAYASLDAGGREVVPTLIDSVQDRDGHVVWRAPGRGCQGCADPAAALDQPPTLTDDRAQIADPQSDFQMVTMMQGVVQHGTGFEAGRGLDRQIAGKTGTTQDFNDAWFAGFTPDLVTVVWVGYDTPASLGEKETGGVIAAPIWRSFMAAALKGRPALAFAPPPGVTMASWSTGYGQRTDAFKPDQTPGASIWLGPGSAGSGGPVTASSDAAGPAAVGGVDSGMGGLY